MSTNHSEVALVTGGAGFIGTHLCRALIKANHKVVSLDLKGTAPKPVEGVNYLQGDARDSKTLSHLLKYYGVTAVYHLAATVSVPLCQKDPLESYSNNVTATLTVLEACRTNETPVRIAFASSAALYGNLATIRSPLVNIRCPIAFLRFMQLKSTLLRKMIELYTSFYQIPSLIFRFFNVYGEGQDPTSPYSGVITIFAKLAKEQKELHLHNAGAQTRDFIPVTDIANSIAFALTLPKEKWDATVINLGTGVPTTVRDLAFMIKTITQSDSKIIDAPAREGDVLHSHADISRAKNLLGLKPNSNLSQGLQSFFGNP